MAPNTILILGAGPRVGYSVARKFKAENYNIAVGSRNPDIKKAQDEGFHPLTVDVGDAQSVEAAFEEVQEKLGVPNVVVYNAAAWSQPSDPEDPFSVSTEAFVKDAGVNIFGAFTALSNAVKGFKSLSNETPKAFIVTGNILPFSPAPFGTTLGSGKAALAHLVNIGAISYPDKNFKFYFASQVTKEGKTEPNLSGDAHGLVYWDLANAPKQGEWEVRFIGDGSVVRAKS